SPGCWAAPMPTNTAARRIAALRFMTSSVSDRFAGKEPIEHIRRDVRGRLVAQQGSRVDDRAGREDRTAGGRAEADKVGAALVGVSTTRQRLQAARRTRTDLVRLVAGGAAAVALVQRRGPE